MDHTCKILKNYELLDKNKVSNKVKNSLELEKKINFLLKENKRSSNISLKINGLGKKILEKLIYELNFFK